MKNSVSDIRAAIFSRDGNKCYYCGARGPEVELHLDHVLPKSKYSLHSLYNLITACKKCNFDKSNHILPDDQYNKIFLYLHKANKIFSGETIKTYSLRLTEYYRKKKKPKKEYNLRSRSLSQYEQAQAQIRANEIILALRYPR